MKWHEFTLPRSFGGKTSHRQGEAANKSAIGNFADIGPILGAADRHRSTEPETAKGRNYYEHGEERPPGNDAELGTNRMATKTRL